ncbi:MAG: methylenetetrahydrofolate reductase [NAD(P)H] [Gemmatimonadota bacterium]|nr:methylenetetrahydrofolate reductase [NAD(P)H] [Gemmatimonadota bacterium]
MRIADAFGPGKPPTISFEFFPPRAPEAEARLFETVQQLAPLKPTYVSVTYGAAGSTRKLTRDIVVRIKRDIGIEAMAHLTCAGHTKEELADILDDLTSSGIENILALRGDPPRGQSAFTPTAGGFTHGSELVEFINGRWDVCIVSAAYPETHQEARDAESDLRHLKTKVENGAEVLITQLFFEAQTYFAFVERARVAGITTPIVPGIMPITNVSQIERFTKMCGAAIPSSLRDLLAGVRDDEDAVTAIGIEWARDQCRALLAGGAPGLHFYTLNRSHSTREILGLLRAEGRV